MLDATLDARVGEAGVELALSVENAGDEAVTLAFPDARRAEFVARVDDGDGGDDDDSDGEGGEEVWRWSRGRMFAQSVGEVTLPPGEGRTFEATWSDPDPGAYRVAAAVAADDIDATAEATVTVPG